MGIPRCGVSNFGLRKELFSLTSETPRDPHLWFDRGEYLNFNYNDALNIDLINEAQTLVMVSYTAPSFYDEQISPIISPDNVLLHKVPDHLPGRILLRLDETESSTVIDDLSQKAHSSSDFACGLIEIIDLKTNLINMTQASFVAPAYLESIHLKEVEALLLLANLRNLETTVATLESIESRYHTHEAGKHVSANIKQIFEEAAIGISDFSVEEISHTTTEQKSVVARIVGTEEPDVRIIIGAHLDSINTSGVRAPGADDNASGIAILVEVLRMLSARGAQFKRTLEFHAYAAEEAGLRGSTAIAKSYKKNKIQVAAMMQLDMTAFSDAADDKIYIISTDTDASLRRTLKDLMVNYLDSNFEEAELSAGTSDHKSWTLQGFRAVFPFEHPTLYNHSIHSAEDTSDNLNAFSLAKRFTKLSAAFLAHYGGLEAASPQYDEVVTNITQLSSDLTVAIHKNTGNTYRMAIASAEEITNVEACESLLDDTFQCQSERFLFELLGEKNKRNFFNGLEDFNGTSGQGYHLIGYNSDHKQVAFRRIGISVK